MKKLLVLGLGYLFLFTHVLAAQDIVGFWKTVDEHSGKPQSIVAIYENQGKFFGRLIATYNDSGKIDDTIYAPKDRAPGVIGNPYYSGLDFIWNMKAEGPRYKDGKIMDPEKGKIYDAEMWIHGDNLIVRGEFLIFGRNQTWPPALDSDFPQGFKKPDLTAMVPVIPHPIHKG